jgi:gluconokinase
MAAWRWLLVMGVSGAGKTAVGAALAARLGYAFLDSDDLHPAANIAKMRAGEPLGDADRAPWLAAIGRWVDAREAEGTPAVVACSALKRRYRDALRHSRPSPRLIFLSGAAATIAARLALRGSHFWPASLLQSQFDHLERPAADEAPIIVDIGAPVPDIVNEIIAKLGSDPGE